MSFLHPEFLYFMLPPLFILFGFLLTQKEQQAQHFSQEVLQKLRVNANTLTLKARNGLFLLIGFLLIVALSGPIIKDGVVSIKAKSADIILALDISDSMLAEDVYPNRLELSKQKAIDFITLAPNERIGVLAFAKNAYLISPLSFDSRAVSFLLKQLNTTSITQKGTDMKTLLEVVDKSIQSGGKKYLLIISDGSDAEDFTKEIAFAKEKNIVVFVLGMGTSKGAPIKLADGSFIKYNDEIIVSKLNDAIATLATQSGGVYIENVKSQDDIKTMLREIARGSEKKELKSEEIARFIPLFYYPLGLALILLLIATSSMSKRVKVELPFAFLLFALMAYQPNAQAGLLDFNTLSKAKKAYENAEYENAAALYLEYAQSGDNPQSYHNAANALYKLNQYEEAIALYEKAHFTDKAQRAQNYANKGNAHVRMQSAEYLHKALEAYEKSLELQEDANTKENYEAVKKALQEQEKQENKDKQENQEQSKENQDEQKEQNQEKEKQEDTKQEEGDKQGGPEKQKEKQSQEEQNQDEAKSGEEDSQQTQKESDALKKEELQDEKKEAHEEKQEKEKLKELVPQENEKEVSQGEATQEDANKMSDAEEAKWIKELNLNQNSYMYILNEENKNQENKDEKPW